MNIWFTADTHYGHSNIVRGTSKWENKNSCRNFETLEEHNNAIVEGINKHVGVDDILYHLGDWAFGGIGNIFEFRDRINPKTIHLNLGNHDHHIGNNKQEPNGSRTTRDLFQSINKVTQKKIGGQDFVLCHYAMRTWDKAHHGTIMLYGHSHGSMPEYGTDPVYTYLDTGEVWGVSNRLYKTTDVGVDVAFRDLGEYRPYHIDEIFKMMKRRIPLAVDHHNEKTT